MNQTKLTQFINKRIYLATAYSANTDTEQAENYIKVNKVAGALLVEGLLVFSPISHTRPIALCCSLPHGFKFYEKLDISFIKWAQYMFIIKDSLWKKSTGVLSEIKIATTQKKPIFLIDSSTLLIHPYMKD
jgi:hypothetical protein